MVVEQHRTERSQLISLQVNGLKLGRRDEAAGLEEGQRVEAQVEQVETFQLVERFARDFSQNVSRQVQHLQNILEQYVTRLYF